MLPSAEIETSFRQAMELQRIVDVAYGACESIFQLTWNSLRECGCCYSAALVLLGGLGPNSVDWPWSAPVAVPVALIGSIHGLYGSPGSSIKTTPPFAHLVRHWCSPPGLVVDDAIVVSRKDIGSGGLEAGESPMRAARQVPCRNWVVP